jgi:hypothetical protein
MAQEQDVRASREEVEAFVGKLRGFHAGLPSPAERAMLESILESAQGGETGGYRRARRRYEDAAEADSSGTSESSSGWNDLIGWIEEQGEEDTQGFIIKRG